MKLLLPKLLAAIALAASPAAGADRGFPFPFPPPFPPPFAPRVTIGTPRFAITFGGHERPHCRPRHEHCWRYVHEREWVPPHYETRLVAYDCHRRPIYDRVVVRRGHWTTVRYRVCGCGVRTRC